MGSATGGATSEFLCLAVAQHSGAACPVGQTASWVIQAASGFDPSIVWSFSSDNVNWVDAISVNPVRNNINGIVSLPTPTADLYWKSGLTDDARGRRCRRRYIRNRKGEDAAADEGPGLGRTEAAGAIGKGHVQDFADQSAERSEIAIDVAERG